MQSLLLISALLLLLSPTSASAQNADDATEPKDRLFQEGLERFEAGKYEAALDSFKRGHARNPRPEFLFAMAQAERLSGDCRSALVFYREFLDTEPAEQHAELAASMIQKCETALGSSALESSAPHGEEVRVREVLVPIAQPAVVRTRVIDYRPWYREPVGLSLLGTGAGSLLTGAAFMIAAGANSRAAPQSATYQEHEALLDRAERQQVYGYVGLATGSALIAAGALYLVFRDPEGKAALIRSSGGSDGLSASLHLDF